MSSTTQTRSGFPPLAAAVTGGIASALVMATMPHVYIEDAVGITGIAELLPAAAPPLGNTARGIIALLCGGMAAAAIFIWLTRNKGKTMDMSAMKFEELREKSRQGAMNDVADAPPPSALKSLLSGLSPAGLLAKMRGGKQDIRSLEDLPKLRGADSHPDTPARKPIFASEDLGAPLTESLGHEAEPFDVPPSAAPHAGMIVADDMNDAADIADSEHPQVTDFPTGWSHDANVSSAEAWQCSRQMRRRNRCKRRSRRHRSRTVSIPFRHEYWTIAWPLSASHS
ncbi:MAG: hypothetical protein U5J78_00560 [Parasphingorhabdus sp.]|nr:hypothetical protein [Parasphingorhabdus sp.]